MQKVIVGTNVEVTITGIQPYGAFALLPDGSSGLIHISEISNQFVKNVEQYVSMGQTVLVKVLDIDEKTNQAKLSLKATNQALRRKEKRAGYLRKPIEETPTGFSSLQENLPAWIEQAKIKLFK